MLNNATDDILLFNMGAIKYILWLYLSKWLGSILWRWLNFITHKVLCSKFKLVGIEKTFLIPDWVYINFHISGIPCFSIHGSVIFKVNHKAYPSFWHTSLISKIVILGPTSWKHLLCHQNKKLKQPDILVICNSTNFLLIPGMASNGYFWKKLIACLNFHLQKDIILYAILISN